MLLWICFALLTAGVIAAIARPLLRDPNETSEHVDADAADVEVYRDQLAEIERDEERGLIGAQEAASARIELSRRILQHADSGELASVEPANPQSGVDQNSVGPSRTKVAYAAAAAIPLITVAVYLAVGAPWLPAQPYAQRFAKPVADASINELVAKVEARLRDHPEDGKGWDVIAPVYMKLQRFDDARKAFTMSRRLLGDDPRRLAGHAEASILAANGVVGEDARLAYQKLLKLQPEHVEARFWLAQASEQDGELTDADKKYRALLASAADDAPWRTYVVERLRVVAEKRGQPLKPDELTKLAGKAAHPTPPAAGPTQEEVAAASEMSAEQRSAMIDGMVSRLAEKLRADGKDLPGWLRLVKAYKVLGRQKEANDALAAARSNFKDDGASLRQLDALASQLGLGS